MICALLAGLPVYADNRASRWVIYYFSGIVNCTPGLLYACEYGQGSLEARADDQGCSEIIGESSEKRGIVMATFNSVACKSRLNLSRWILTISRVQRLAPS